MRYPVSKNTNLGIEKYKKLWEPVGICLINSTTNAAQLGWKWAELPLLHEIEQQSLDIKEIQRPK
jgi:hypothetical protein